MLACAEIPQLRFLFCAHDTVSFVPFQMQSCQLPDIFVRKWMEVPLVSQLIGQVKVSEAMFHIGVICVFANLIGPFGGFFASGVKRALKIKAK